MTIHSREHGPFNTGRVGFGCAYITGGFEKRQNLKLLKRAFDSDIRHYDTAPMYGHGTSEAVVGEAFKTVRGQISIATKVGIPRPDFPLKRQLLRMLATPVRRHLPQISQKSAAIIYRGNSVPKCFSADYVRRSVEESLSQLNTDYVDVLLLHEAALADISEDLLNTLAALKMEGKILRTGVGSFAEDIASINAAYPDLFDVYQRTWSVRRTDETLYPDKTNVFHRAVMDALLPLRDRLASDQTFADHVRKYAGLGLSAVDDLAKALISASLFVNPNGITLFATRRLYRVASYAKETPGDLATGIALLKAYRTYDETSAPKMSVSRCR